MWRNLTDDEVEILTKKFKTYRNSLRILFVILAAVLIWVTLIVVGRLISGNMKNLSKSVSLIISFIFFLLPFYFYQKIYNIKIELLKDENVKICKTRILKRLHNPRESTKKYIVKLYDGKKNLKEVEICSTNFYNEGDEVFVILAYGYWELYDSTCFDKK